MGQSSTKSERPQSVTIGSWGAADEGFYIDTTICGKPISLLVDTGASVTIISKKFLDNIDSALVPGISTVKIKMMTATGELTPFNGETQIYIRFGKNLIKHNVLIADIPIEGILGMDFLTKNGCDVLLSKNCIKYKGQEVPCFKYRSSPNASCCRICIHEKIVLPPSSETIVSGRAIDPIIRGKTGLVEPVQKFVEKHGLLIARAVVQPNAGFIPMKILNVSDQEHILQKNTLAATLEPVEVDMITTCPNLKISEISPQGKIELPEHMQAVFDNNSNELTESQKIQFKNLLFKYQESFSQSSTDIGRTELIEHTIDTGQARPVKQRPRRIPLSKIQEAEAEIEKMAAQGIIEPSTSPWNSNVVLLRKKDQSLRFCIDFRILNSYTIKDSHPLPRIDDTLDALSGSKIYSTLDLKSEYHQVSIAKGDRPKTAFSFPGSGLWQFTVLAFGLCNAPAVFERLMLKILSGLTWKTCLVYLDDIIVHSKTFQGHLENLAEVLERLKQANLKLNPKKCRFFQKQVTFLGHVVSEKGVSTDPEKTEAVEKWPTPKNIKEVRSFLGLCSYYRKFIFHFADIARPLHKLTEKNQSFIWSKECNAAFEALKEALTHTPILSYPRNEDSFILDTDASNTCMGAVLSQVQDGQEKVIAYFSKAFSRTEKKYCVTRRELLAVVSSIKQFHHYLYGRHFLVRTDHGALRWLLNFKNPEGQIARWFEILAAYDFKIEHRAGRSHANADALSRRPCINANCGHCNRAEQKCQYNNELQNQLGNKNNSPRKQNSSKVSWDQSVEMSAPTLTDKDNVGVYVTTRSGKMLDSTASMSSHEAMEQGNYPSVASSHSQDPTLDLSGDKLGEYQRNDNDLNLLISFKEKGEKPPWETVSPCSPAVKYYWTRWDSLCIKQGILYYKWENAQGSEEKLLTIVPSNLINLVLTQLHNSVTGGHLGVKKTLSKVRQRFSWYKHRQDVENWCRRCDICASKKPPIKKPHAPLQQYNVGAPLERTAVDILGPLPRTNKGNRYLLVVGDYFSKWADAIPIRDQEAVTIAKKLVERVITILGVPMEIHSDQGANFESQVFKEMCKLLGLHKTRTTGLRPQSDGMVERANATILNMLSSFVADNQKDWDDYIYLVMMAYRASAHETTKVSPYEMMFGRSVNLPIDLVIGQPKSNFIAPEYNTEYVYELSKKLEQVHQFARKHIALSSNTMKRLYDRSTNFHKYNPGDAVWLYNPVRSKGLNPKLQRPWQGPFTVVERINDVIYRIKKGPRTKPKIVHHDRLKLYAGEQQ